MLGRAVSTPGLLKIHCSVPKSRHLCSFDSRNHRLRTHGFVASPGSAGCRVGAFFSLYELQTWSDLLFKTCFSRILSPFVSPCISSSDCLLENEKSVTAIWQCRTAYSLRDTFSFYGKDIMMVTCNRRWSKTGKSQKFLEQTKTKKKKSLLLVVVMQSQLFKN